MSDNLSRLRRVIQASYLRDETEYLRECLDYADASSALAERIHRRAFDLVSELRSDPSSQQGLDAFLSEYDLSSEEGVVLMCLAEALLRIPDADTADRLIRDKLSRGKWDDHLGQSESSLVNASTWGLMLTGKVIRLSRGARSDVASFFRNLTIKAGEPVIRLAIKEAMGIMGQQFVLGETIERALQRSKQSTAQRYHYSFDMLGEAALTSADADRFFTSYVHALETIGKESARNAISVKLSALHPRFAIAQRQRVMTELVPRLSKLARIAADNELMMTIDAEEADRLELNLDVFEAVFKDPGSKKWSGLGMVVQAYQKRSLAALKWLNALASAHSREIPVRLVKGAYWDTEIKLAQVSGLEGYPVFTRKSHTDVAYMACARLLLEESPSLYPQFATHNAHTISAVMELAGSKSFEFQRLHGMGQGMYDRLLDSNPELKCRVYAPVGGHAELLPYLVRRLLENGANTSFVNRISQADVPVDDVVADPIVATRALGCAPHPGIPLPERLYGDQRKNSVGINFGDPLAVTELEDKVSGILTSRFASVPVIDGERRSSPGEPVCSPADRRRILGEVCWSTAADTERAKQAAERGFERWHREEAHHRAGILERAADLLEENNQTLIALCVAEGGRILRDADSEVREAVDFCRFYAQQARLHMSGPEELPGPSGERNTLTLRGRGIFVCISPWNFPVAIFLGQITAALAAGNAVIAKPAEQTP